MKNIALRVMSIHMYHDEWQFHRMSIEHSSSYPGTQVFVTYLSNFSYDENIFFICLLGIFPTFRWFNIILKVLIVCCFRCFHKLFLYTYVLYINRDKIKFWWLSILRNGVVSIFLFRTMHCGLNCHENILRVLLNFLETLIKKQY